MLSKRKSQKGVALVNMQITVTMCFVLVVGLLAACGSNANNSADLSKGSTSVSSNSLAPASGETNNDTNQVTEEPVIERTFTDELGNTVVLPDIPVKIYAPYLEDSLIKLGVTPVAQWANAGKSQAYLQDQLKDVPLSDLSTGLPSPEVVLSYQPDLIILHTATFVKDGVYENYAKIAPTYVFNNASGDVAKSLTTLGELLGKSSEAEAALHQYEAKIAASKAVLDEAVGGKKVAIIRFAAKGVNMMGKNYLAGFVVHQQLGIGNSKFVDTENSFNVSLEVLPDLDADYIFYINQYGQGTERLKEMTDSSIWQSIPAVKNGKVFEVNAEYWLGSGLIAYEKIVDDTVKLLTE